jgi:hypothetical protein
MRKMSLMNRSPSAAALLVRVPQGEERALRAPGKKSQLTPSRHLEANLQRSWVAVWQGLGRKNLMEMLLLILNLNLQRRLPRQLQREPVKLRVLMRPEHLLRVEREHLLRIFSIPKNQLNRLRM